METIILKGLQGGAGIVLITLGVLHTFFPKTAKKITKFLRRENAKKNNKATRDRKPKIIYQFN